MEYWNSNPDNIRFPALGRSLDHQTSSRSVTLRPSFAESGFTGFRPLATALRPHISASPKQSPALPPCVLQAPIRCAILRACRTEELDTIMNIPEWTKPALLGAGAGAIVLAIIGFNWGGWMTADAAARMSDRGSTAAVASALTPYCLANAKADPMAASVMSELKTANSYQRRGIVEKSGWATPLGAESPDRALAENCLDALDISA
jgi:hypothetical protein